LCLEKSAWGLTTGTFVILFIFVIISTLVSLVAVLLCSTTEFEQDGKKRLVARILGIDCYICFADHIIGDLSAVSRTYYDDFHTVCLAVFRAQRTMCFMGMTPNRLNGSWVENTSV
jgi:hypothetical protein